ncbi:helix-turn-helix domain-containing protein [Mycolicibacterium sp.]|uniref:helix-turn-helix domain-containing protein n=1 Tax=Mycolicibacterium sp. TaxID=2320850 RepID=UPI001A20CA9D|nr:helix-turn-helix domain-containing protein [Mycolicibacterium sp.]MBJ7336182.1 helix-turn-helix domain-containing protein [Mycolicibacterium sp.]
MRGSTSAPTARVLDVVELLGRPGRERLRFSDVVRELDLTQATAHAILKTLSDRGWISRDPVDKTFSLGPALAVVASRADVTRARAHAARAAAIELSAELGFRASALERHSDSLLITAFEGGGPSDPGGHPGERIPYAPPFGVAFAAWDTPEGQVAWIHRTAASNPGLADNLALCLARTRERGYDVDLTTPALAQTAQLVGALRSDGMPAHVRQIMDQLLVETMVGFTDDDIALEDRPVVTIAAPVFDEKGCVTMILAVHPLRTLTAAETARVGRRLIAATTSIGA